MNKICLWVLASVLTTSAWAKLPAPSDEAKAKAAEASAKEGRAVDLTQGPFSLRW